MPARVARPSAPVLAALPFAAACAATPPPVVEAGRGGPPPLIAESIADHAAYAAAIRQHYVKYEHRIPMRDGVKLFTAVYAPRDTSRTYPILLLRTPYGAGPYGVDAYPTAEQGWLLDRFAPSSRILRDGYILVHQDVRGRLMSEGTFVDVRPAAAPGGTDESTDAYDTIDWLVKHVPGNNGQVGAWGISYPGFYAAQAAIDAHPALKVVSPQAPVTEWFIGDDFHHNGALCLASALDFFANFGRPRPAPTPTLAWDFEHDIADSYDFFLALGPLGADRARNEYLKSYGEIAFWNDLHAHGTRDAYWVARDPRPRYAKARPAIMTVGGWFDAEDLWGSLATYQAWEKQSPGADNVLVMGPWKHGGWARTPGDRLGEVRFDAPTSRHYLDAIEAPFFGRLRGGPATRAPEARVFETGTNVWRTFDAWPPPATKSAALFLRAGGGLGPTPDATPGADAYPSDPSKPVPYFGELSKGIDADYMTGDQRFAARRPDVLVYVTPPLAADVTIAGPVEAKLWVSITGTDADFVVKLVDVYPEDRPDPEPNPKGVKLGGYQQLVRGEVMRGKFRRSFETPEPFEPGVTTPVAFELPDTLHAFRAGHRIMVQVQSSWFPLVDRNPQTFTDIYRATEKDFRSATHTVHRGGETASRLEVRVLSGSL